MILVHMRHIRQLRRVEFPDEGAEEDELDAAEVNDAEEFCNASGANSAWAENPGISKENSNAQITQEKPQNTMLRSRSSTKG